MADKAYAAIMAERIRDACYEALLDWGAAVNAAEAAPEGPVKETETLRARIAGGEAQRLAMGLAAKLRPEAKR